MLHKTLLIFALLISPKLMAATYYVDSAASPQGQGTMASPASLTKALRFASYGDTLILNNGQYALNQTARFLKGYTLRGVSQNGVIINCNSSCFTINTGSTQKTLLKNITLVQTGPIPMDGISLVEGQLLVDGVTFKGFDSAIRDYPPHFVKVRVENSQFYDVNNGIKIINGYLERVINSTFSVINQPMGGFGILTNQPSSQTYGRNLSLTLADNRFEHMGLGLGLLSDANSSGTLQILVAKNIFTHTGVGTEISLNGNSRSVIEISDNDYLNDGSNAISLSANTGITNITINRNAIDTHNNGQGGIFVSTPASPNSHVDIANNEIIYNDFGIHVSSTTANPQGNITLAYNTLASESNRINTGLLFENHAPALVANNIVERLTPCINSCYGLRLDASVSEVVQYAGNNIHGFIDPFLQTNTNFVDETNFYGLNIPTNTESIVPFMPNSFDLSQSFPADINAYTVIDDIDGNLRGITPDKGAYQH